MKMKSFVGLLIAGASFAACGANNFGKIAEFTCSGYTGASTLANFPVLVRLAANSPTGFQYTDMVSSASGVFSSAKWERF